MVQVCYRFDFDVDSSKSHRIDCVESNVNCCWQSLSVFAFFLFIVACNQTFFRFLDVHWTCLIIKMTANNFLLWNYQKSYMVFSVFSGGKFTDMFARQSGKISSVSSTCWMCCCWFGFSDVNRLTLPIHLNLHKICEIISRHCLSRLGVWACGICEWICCRFMRD